MTGPRGPVAGQNTGSRGAVRADRYGDSDMPILGYQQLQQIGVAILRATGTPQHDAELVAEELAEAFPCADKIRYATSGTEATFNCLRIASAYKKREKILKLKRVIKK